MTEHISAYIKEVNQLYQTGVTTEHSFRPALQRLLQDCTHLIAINEPSHIACGAPDFKLLTSSHLAVAYVEAKDLFDNDLDGKKKNKEQFDRYKNALDTIVFTDYLDFHLYADGAHLDTVQLALEQNGKIVLNESQIGRFESLIEKLRSAHPQKITSSVKLAKLMAGKARLMADAVKKSLDNDTNKNGSLWHQLLAFQDVLNKDLDAPRFADLYAQTIAYGLFAARIHDTTPLTFSRQEAASLIPHSNPFLRQIFQQLAGYDINDSIAWIVDDLVNIFAATDVKSLRKNFGKEMQRRDPMIHFYEDFLKYYDPAAKKKFGVYYTPQPVVEFIVRAVDDILKTDFALPKGLADTSKVDVTVQEMEEGSDMVVSKVISKHRVQVLDPATGTGTFLAEVVGRIKEQQQKGAWSSYVDEHLLPRIYGFEYMMAPYTIAHLKLDMLINWWGDDTSPATHNNRLQIYLTNSLDQTELTNKHLLAEMIAREANEANNIKHNAPVMIVMGNPPYSALSDNNGKWITDLLADYKKEPGGILPLKERKIWLNDDYCKFIRLGQYYVDKNNEGVLAYICNNGFLDAPTFRGMRWSLLHSFDKIYIINLHGNSKRKETALDGSKDESVFDILVGTSINIFVKNAQKKEGELAEVYYADVLGLRESKYNYLSTHSLENIKFKELKYTKPFYFLTPTDEKGKVQYNEGFKIENVFCNKTLGFVTANDKLNISFNEQEQKEKIKDLIEMPEHEWRIKYERKKDARDWKYLNAKNDAAKFKGKVQTATYRPFDTRYTYYTGISRGLYSSPQSAILAHMLHPNMAFIIGRQGLAVGNMPWNLIYCTDAISDLNIFYRGGGTVFPLYLYPSKSELGFETERKPNLDETIWRSIENWVKYGQAFKPLTTNEQSGEIGFDVEPEQPHTLTPEDIFDYIYGVLHSPNYREKYKEFLKVDFPRIPYPKNAEEFEHFRNYGHQLRELHLMHNVPESSVTFPYSGNMTVEAMRWEWNKDDGYSGNVWINDTQCFEGVPAVAWNLFIGGYQPAQKWLKDRKGRALSSDDVEHYRNIITVLCETDRLMKEIDKENLN